MAWYWWVLAAFLVAGMWTLHKQAWTIWRTHERGEGREAAYIPMAFIGGLFFVLLWVVFG
ncbi:MAG: hypothetical protein ACRERV_14500 [Methylococcales bacterium]